MEDDNRGEGNDEVTGGVEKDGAAGQQERGTDNQYQQTPRPPSSRKRTRDEIDSRQQDRKPSRSRSRSSSSRPLRKQWRSANAFLNFMQDFRQNCNKAKSKDLFRLGGQTWRQMSSADKMPYVEAAKLAQQQSQQSNKSAQQNKSNGSDSSKKPEGQRDQKKKEQGARKERRRSRSKRDDSDAESDSATSGTGVTVTSEDVSDLSS
ncbi:PREDICTED: high mobility group B protein 2-like [Vollenhovia emeryi]|uniref:high mobility group B protein 2-like n=1 Tax=Vollenhovia emeryi TaxID=411798 RepID=UPI0005F52355|nr:PREDICTED: high mobility group B protein 2-like [Vollenhovia emeryi]